MWWRIFAGLSALVFVLVSLTGCSTFTPNAFPDEFGEAAKSFATSFHDQAVWQELAGEVKGEVIEPGGMVFGGMIYVAGAKLTGVSGRMGLEAEGGGTGELTDEARTAIIEMLSDPGLLEKLLMEQPPADVPPATVGDNE